MVDSMIRLFPETATEFTTNGIGYLPDATECVVTEQRNGIFELKMKYPITGRHYHDLSLRSIIVAPSNPYDNPQPFRIYEITKPMKKLVTIYAEHISYDMSGYPVSPFEASNAVTALESLKSHSAVTCPFTFWTDKSTSATMKTDRPYAMRALLGGQEGSILDVYGGEYKFDGYLVRLYGDRGDNRGVSIRYGKNLTDVQQEENCAAVYTGVYPYWISEAEDGSTVLVTAEPKMIEAPGTFNFQRIMMLDCTSDFQEQPTPEQLKTRAENYISANDVGVPKVSIDVSFVDLMSSPEYETLQLLETVHLCDTVSVEFEELGVKATSKCVKTEYNVLNGTYNSITLGESRGSIASTIVTASKETKSEFEKTIEREKYLNNRVIVTVMDETGKRIDSVRDDLGNQIITVQDELGNQIITVQDEFGNEIKVVVDEFGNVTDSLGNKIDTVKDELGNEIIVVRDDLGNEIAMLYLEIVALRTEQQQAIDHATKLITGNLGGNVILHSSTGGDTPDEILIMDTTNIATAKKIWRWNLAGLGYSNKGYNGPYELAMTMDGVFVADFIQTGTMSANRIKGGTLELGGVNNGNGTIVVKDGSGNVIGQWNNAGLTATGDLILQKKINNVNYTVKLGEVVRYGSLGSSNKVGGLSVNDLVALTTYGLEATYGISDSEDYTTSVQIMSPYVEESSSSGGSVGSKWHRKSYLSFHPSYIKFNFQCPSKLENAISNPLIIHGPASTWKPTPFRNDAKSVSEFTTPVCFKGNTDAGIYSYLQNSTTGGIGATFVSVGSSYYRLYGGTTSSIRWKIYDRDLTEDDILDLYNIHVVMARFKDGILCKEDERNGVNHPMFIAEDVNQYAPLAVDHEPDGNCENWNQKIMIPLMFQMIKSQKDHIDQLESQVTSLQNQINELRELITNGK